MAEETETAEVSTEEPAADSDPESTAPAPESQQNAEVSTEEPEAPATPAAPVPVVAQSAPIDIDAELAAKETLADQLDRGDVTIEQYAKQTAAIDRKITRAQREMVQPVQQTLQAQNAARQYWGNWGKGQDVAQLQYGKSIPAAKARTLYQQAQAAIDANPRYQRAEYQNDPHRMEAIVTEKWLDSLAAEAKKPAPARQQAPQAGARVSGSGAGSGSAAPGAAHKTAKQKLEDGDYDVQLSRLA